MSDKAVVVFVLLFGAGAYFLMKNRQAPATAEDQLRARIFSLPGELKYAEKQAIKKAGDMSTLEGVTTGASIGVVGGPWGIAIGAGAGAVASIWT
jgi:hypothetical protein